MKNAMIMINDDYARIATEFGIFETLRLHEGLYVRIDDGHNYPQLCVGASRKGNTLTFHSPAQLARDCNATLYKTAAGFERAAERIVEINNAW